MKAIVIHPGHELWEVHKNQCKAYAFTVVIVRAWCGFEVLDYIDTSTEMAACTVADAVNLGIITDWRQLYG